MRYEKEIEALIIKAERSIRESAKFRGLRFFSLKSLLCHVLLC